MPNPALFRPGTSDRNIWKSVVDGDEYCLPNMTQQDVCVDIGGQTGAATYAMLQKGAGKVIAFEPDPNNFLLFRKQLKQEIKDGRVEVYPFAVVGGIGVSWRTFSGPVQKDGEVNHGGAFVFGPHEDDHGFGQYIMNQPQKVLCIAFDEIGVISDLGDNRRLLKIDAEMSEWEILLESMGVGGFRQIVGEYHPTGSYKTSDLEKTLIGFEWTFQPHPNSELGLFWATRK